ncbi:hypothetical protein IQ254_06290 [Nodosilinea sp. LEGE 07088]|uniref:hypothetical protein n=1 Tax=Nodosilinea sp. LEGE 07088 TaxID=2777968 RepID=UPI00187E858A|nr:hypothetical protein [Nodosilinea sp. LEGE 07088]MBE9136817.1 hypothetical protein [Nodosilinea sp. LEGE 07088]
MLGTFQHSRLRIEVEATRGHIQASLVQPSKFSHWLWPQRFSQGLPTELYDGLKFISYLGPVEIHHEVKQISDHGLRLLLSGAIDGFHEWYWGDQWVQSRLEGVSALPINLGQSLIMMQLRQYLQRPTP